MKDDIFYTKHQGPNDTFCIYCREPIPVGNSCVHFNLWIYHWHCFVEEWKHDLKIMEVWDKISKKHLGPWMKEKK